MPPIRQSNFTGGELDPAWHGRTDLERYHVSLRRARNMLVSPAGLLVNRPGSQMVKEVKTSSQKTRLIPFLFGGGQNYALEFGDLYFRVHYLGAYLSVEVVTTYVEADLFQLYYVQSGDILTIVHPSYPVREVKRTGHTTWAIADKVFTAGQAAPTNPGNTLLDVATAPLRPWSWAISAVGANGEESVALTYTPAASHVEAATPANITWTAAAGAVRYVIRRGQNGIYGWIGESTGTSFRDDGQAPDYSNRPHVDTNPFNAADKRPAVVTYHEQRLVFAATTLEPNAVWASRTGDFRNYDRVEPPLDDDAILLRLASRQFEEIRGLVSVRGLLTLTSQAEWAMGPAAEGDAMSATNVKAVPHSYRGAAKLQPIALGEVGLFVQERGSLVHDLFFEQQVEGYRGTELSHFARHLVDGHSIVDWAFARNPWGIVWAVREDGVLLGLTYDRDTGTYAWHWHDTARLSTTDSAIVDKFESVCVVPEGTEDRVYVVVKRGAKRYVERFATRQVFDARLGVFLDNSLTYDGRVTDGTTVNVHDGSGYGIGDGVVITSSAAKFAAGDATDQDWVVLQPDLPLASPATLANQVRIRITTFNSTTEVEGIVLDAIPVGLYEVAVSSWSIARHKFSGADHLNNTGVGVLADGNFLTPAAPSSGVLTLPTIAGSPVKASIVHVGRRYWSEMEVLDLPPSELWSRGQLKLVQAVGVELHGSARTEYYASFHEGYGGEALNKWRPQGQLEEAAGNPAFAAGGSMQYLGEIRLRWDVDEIGFDQVWDVALIPLVSSWNTYGRAILTHESPLPIAVRSLWREVVPGG